MSDQNDEGRGRRDAFEELQARLERAVDDLKPKFRRALDELDATVDSAMSDLKPKVDAKVRQAQPRVDSFLSDVQPRMDSLLRRVQAKLEEVRVELESRAARRDESGSSSGARAGQASEPAPPESTAAESDATGAPESGDDPLRGPTDV